MGNLEDNENVQSQETEYEDDYLFDRFIIETDKRVQEHTDLVDAETQFQESGRNTPVNGRQTGNIELRRTIGNILSTLEIELQRAQQRNNSNGRNSNRNNGQHHVVNIGPNEAENDESLFTPRRSYFSMFIRNLLVLDYFVMVILFPFSFYNILRSGFSSITLSDNDFIAEIISYLKYAQVVSDIDSTPLMLLGYSEDGTMGLLGKFHNIVVFYSAPIIKLIVKLNIAKIYLIKLYEICLKMIIVTIYLIYGLSGTIYLGLSCFFFIFCLALTIIRRYKNVQKMLVTNLILSSTPEDIIEANEDD